MPPPSPAIIRELAEEAGFDLVRFGPADPGQDGPRFLQWLEQGRAGTMDYLSRNRQVIADPQRYLDGARSTIALATDYGGPPGVLPGGGRVARYAVGRDYHRALGQRLRRLRARLEREGLPRGAARGGTDALPVLERALAVRAGIGFLAKSTMVIGPHQGPYLHLAELLTTRELPFDPPATGQCGTCTACLDACPTGALVAPFELDARLCLSYTTIEHRGPIPRELRARQGDWFFGCDVCLEVCPFTRHSSRVNLIGDRRPAELRPHRVFESWTLVDILDLSQQDYDAHWTGTAMRRGTRSGLRRNAAIVLGNVGDEGAVPALEGVLDDPDPMVRGHAAWALGRLAPSSRALAARRARELDSWVLGEIEAALGG